MTTIYTHAVVGVGIAQLYLPKHGRWLYWALAGILPVLPDCDVFATAAYGSLLGHRGFTHSFAFALWFGFFAASLCFRYLQANFWMLGGIFFAAIASHGILDAMTRGGADVPLFWPMVGERFGNWGPIPVSDIGFEFPDPRRSRALRSELLWVWVPTAVWIAAACVYRLVH